MPLQINRAAYNALGPADRQLADQALQSFTEKVQATPMANYFPSPAQAELLKMNTPVMAAFAGNRFGKCLRVGTLVRMADGTTRPIEQIRAGEYVVGVNADGSTSPTQVCALWDNGTKPIYRYRFSKRGAEATFDATLEHKMLVRPESASEYRILPAGELKKRWIAPRTPGFAANTTGPDEEYATFLGLMLGDGHISSHHRERSMQFTNIDEDILDLMRVEVDSHEYSLTQNSANPIQYRIARSGQTFTRSPLRDKAEEFGLNRYSYDKEIPEVVWSWSNEAVAKVIAGLILTDGTVTKCDGVWRVCFNSTSRPLVEGLKELLETRFGVYGSEICGHTREERRPEYHFGIGNFEALRRFQSAIPLVGIKKSKLDAAIADWTGKRSDGGELIYRDREYIGEEQVYDITVDNDTHLFALANGLAVSNTSAGAIKCLIDALDEEDVPDHLRQYKKWQPPFHAWILGPTLGDSIDNVIIPELKKWIPKHALMGGSWDKAFSVGRRTLTFRNGSKFKFFAYANDHEQLTGAAVHRVWYDEPPPQKHRNEAMMRLATLDGDELFTMTPLHGVSWLQKAIWKERHDPDISVIKGSGFDNPIMSKKALERIIAQYPEEERQARLHGDFVFFSGRIFPEFNHRDHVVPQIQPADLRDHEIIVSIDPGWDHGFAVTFNAFDINGCCLTFDEIHARGKIVAQVSRQIKERLDCWRITPDYFLIDGKGGRQTSVITGHSAKKEFSRYGIICRYAKNDPNSWMPSVNRMRAMLATTDLEGEPTEPRLKVTENCTYTIDGYVSYHFKDDANDDSAQDRTPRPYKKDDDELDTVRYAVMSRTYRDPFFMEREEEEEPPDLHKVAAMGYHLEQLRREEELQYSQY